MSGVWLLIVAVVILLIAALIWGTSRRNSPTGPSGFGGWLILLVIAETIAPFVMVVGTLSSFRRIPSLSQVPNGAAVSYGSTAISLVLAGFVAYVAIAMWCRSYRFPLLFTWQWIIAFAHAALEPAFIAAAFGVPAATLYGDQTIIRGIVQAAIGGLWVWYVLRSVRVKNTFMRGRRPASQLQVAHSAEEP